MARLSKDDVRKWQSRLELSENWRKPWKEKWDRFSDYLQGYYFDSPKDNEDQIAVNLVFPMVRVIIPSIYSRNPDVLVSARRPEFQGNTQAMSQFLKYMIKEMDLKEEVKLVLLDTLLVGHGWAKAGYESEFQEQEEESSIASFLRKLFKPEEEENDYAIRPNEKLVEERPWVLRVSYDDMFVPAFTKNYKTMPWIAERMVMPIQDVKDNPRFKNTKDLKPSSNIKEYLRDKTGVGNLDPEDTEYCCLYEIHDGREGKIYTIAEENELPLEEKDTEYTMLNQRYPYFMLRFNEVPDQFYPQSDVEAWEPQIHELNKIRTQQSIHRKRFNRRYLYKNGALSDEAIDDLKNGEDGTLVEVEGEENLENVLHPVEDATLSPDTYATESRIKDDITEISGITGYQRGSISQGAKTATEASIVEAQSRSRSDERVDGVNSFVVRLIRAVAQISQAFLTQEDVYPILGDELTTQWVTITPEDIKGEFMYDVVFGSSLPINKEVDRQQYLQLYEMISADPAYDIVKPRIELLRKFDVRDPEKWLNAQLIGRVAGQEPQPPLPPPPPGGGPGVEAAPPLAAPPSSGVPSPASIRASISKQIGTPQPGGVGGKLA